MLKIILVISLLFYDSLNQNKIDLINHYSKINFLESDFELVTYQSKKEKFRNNGFVQVENQILKYQLMMYFTPTLIINFT